MTGLDPGSPGEMLDTFFVLDVESIGLHGEGFACGFVVLHTDGRVLTEGLHACPPGAAAADPSEEGAGRQWVAQHCPPLDPQLSTPRDVRDAFWREWLIWQRAGAVLIADCPWPVEARFVSACIADLPQRRAHGPYPLMDVGSVLYAAGFDPTGTFERETRELPQHDPLADARQSARLLLEARRVLARRRDWEEKARRPPLRESVTLDPSPAVKLCHECRMHDTAPHGEIRCMHPLVNKRDPWALSRPDGAPHGSDCRSERSRRWPFGACGMRGALWTPHHRWPRSAPPMPPIKPPREESPR